MRYKPVLFNVCSLLQIEMFPQFFLDFEENSIFIFLRITGQSFCTIILGLQLSNASLWLDLVMLLGPKYHRSDTCFSYSISSGTYYVCLSIIGGDSLIKMSTKFSSVKLLYLFFLLELTILCGGILRLSHSSFHFHPLVLMSFDISCLNYHHDGCQCSNSVIAFIFII